MTFASMTNGTQARPMVTEPAPRQLSLTGLAGFFGRYPSAKVLDVRLAYEREAGHFPNDHHVPWFTPAWDPNPDFLDQVLQHVSPDDTVLVTCRCGYRASEAAMFLENAGFQQVFSILGGYDAIRPPGEQTAQRAAPACCCTKQGDHENEHDRHHDSPGGSPPASRFQFAVGYTGINERSAARGVGRLGPNEA